MRVTHEILSALEKIIIVDVSRHKHSEIPSICDKITVLAGMFLSALGKLLPLNLAKWWLILRGS